jgi:hypothetical protein
MAITFTDPELRAASHEVLFFPVILAIFNKQKDQAITEQQKILLTDDSYAVFYNHYSNIIANYHTERKHLNGSTNTNYDTQNLIDAAQQLPGNVHFPTSPLWVNLIPKLVSSINGSPSGSVSTFESDAISKITPQISLLTSGFTDGAVSEVLNSAYTSGNTINVTGNTSGNFVSGNRIVVDNANVSLFATVNSVTLAGSPPKQVLNVTILAPPSTTLPTGSRIRNFSPGFTNSEREGTTTAYAPEVMNYFKSLIDPEVSYWQTELLAEQVALLANDAVGPEASEISTARTNVANALSVISFWLAAPSTGAGTSRYGDTQLTPLQSQISTRTTAIPVRLTQISTRLGSVSQIGDGSYTGSGNYFNLFKWVDLRISKAGGSLLSYYNFNLVISYLDQKIVQTTDKKAQLDSSMLVIQLLDNEENPPAIDNTSKVFVNDTTGISVSDSIKIIDDNTSAPSSTVSIVSIVPINGGRIEIILDTVIYGYNSGDFAARLVKLL